MASNTTRKIAKYGLFCALIFVAFYIDSMLSVLLPIKFAIVTIVTVATLILLSQNYFEAALAGIFFGLSSLVSQFYAPKVPEFLYPWVSVLPRLLVGLGTFGMFRLVYFLLRNTKNNKTRIYVSAISAAAVAPIINTFFVMLMLSLCRQSPFLDMLMGVLVLNFLPEFAGCIIAAPLITMGVSKGTHLKIAGQASLLNQQITE